MQSRLYFPWSRHSNNSFYPDIWSNELLCKYDIKKTYGHVLRCLNIGNCAARNIEIQWSYDVDAFAKLIRRRDPEGNFTIKQDCRKIQFINNSKSPRAKGLYWNSIAGTRLDRVGMDFVLPARGADDAVDIVFNQAYLSLVALYYFAIYSPNAYKEDGFVEFFCAEIPKCRLDIKYRGIDNRRFGSSFLITFRAIEHEMHLKPRDGGLMLWGRLEIDELDGGQPAVARQGRCRLFYAPEIGRDSNQKTRN